MIRGIFQVVTYMVDPSSSGGLWLSVEDWEVSAIALFVERLRAEDWNLNTAGTLRVSNNARGTN
jgi:hypothetical protein